MDKPILKNEHTLKSVLADEGNRLYNKHDPVFVSIRSMVDANTYVTGAVTGKRYVFAGAGSIQDVDKRDADEILNKKRGQACCGHSSGKSLFELA